MAGKIYPSDQQSGPNGAYYNHKQQLPPPATYRAAGRSRSYNPFCCNPFCCCFRWICSLLVTIIIILAIVVAILYFTLHPKSPKYSLLGADIAQLNITGNPPELNYDINFTLQAYNPNKKIGIYYDDIQVFLFYEGVQVGQSFIPPFYQGHKDTHILSSNLVGKMVSLPQNSATDLQTAIIQQSIPFQIHVKVKARVKIFIWKSPHIKVKDNCNLAISPPSAAGGARLLSQSCKVKWGF